jgi:hypothetical protein
MGRACNMHGELRNAYKILLDKPAGKTPLRRHRCRWESIKMDLKEIMDGGCGLDSSAQNRS